jgi:adenylosuccinate synthase
VYTAYPGWSESLSEVRRFADLPAAARRYVAAMVKSVLDVAYAGEPWPAVVPNLRYLGVGPHPSQIIHDVPPTRDLIGLAG